MTVFISGSIAIRRLPVEVRTSFEKMIDNNLHIIVGDAKGVDLFVQRFFNDRKYFNLTVYHITEKPRVIVSDKFRTKRIYVSCEIKGERVRQMEKDKQMSLDCDYGLVVWDGKSKGSYFNILRMLEQDKRVRVYVTTYNSFIAESMLKKKYIDTIYRSNNGYSASEVIKYLNSEINGVFRKVQDLNKYLLQKRIIRKEGNVYIPEDKYSHLFLIRVYKGKQIGISYKDEFLNWIAKELRNQYISESQKSSYEQGKFIFT